MAWTAPSVAGARRTAARRRRGMAGLTTYSSCRMRTSGRATLTQSTRVTTAAATRSSFGALHDVDSSVSATTMVR